MNVYMELYIKRNVTVDTQQLNEILSVCTIFLEQYFPNVTILNPEHGEYIGIRNSVFTIHRYVLSIEQRDINRLKLANYKEIMGMLNGNHVFVDTLLLLNGANSSISSYYIGLVESDE